MSTKTAAMPRSTTLKERSLLGALGRLAARRPTSCTSATPRLMPEARFLRIWQSVKQAPTSMPPTAIGRTM